MKVAPSFSTGRLAYEHDMRISYKNNVDRNLSKDNVVLVDKLQGKTIEEYTNEKMQPIIDEYNASQKRNDRKIKTDYMTYHNKLKNKHKIGEVAYEAVIQFGEHSDLGERYYQGDKSVGIEYRNNYERWLHYIEEEYPHLEILYAVIHFDEPNGTPHMHVAFQPIADGYDRSLEKKCSIGKALALDGIERAETRLEGFQLERFYKSVQEHMKEDLIEQGYEIKEPTNEKRKHLYPEEYIEVKKSLDKMDKKLDKMSAEYRQGLAFARSRQEEREQDGIEINKSQERISVTR